MPLDRVPKHGSRHHAIMLAQETVENLAVPLSDFAQHPPHGLVYEVVRVAEQQLGNDQRRPELIALDEIMGGDDGDAPLPEVL